MALVEAHGFEIELILPIQAIGMEIEVAPGVASYGMEIELPNDGVLVLGPGPLRVGYYSVMNLCGD